VVLPVTAECNQNHRTPSTLSTTFAEVTLSRVGTMLTFGFRSRFRARAGRTASSNLGQALGWLLLVVAPLFAANHPAITGKNANCALCHADMTQGKSVHSQGELACGLCHSAEPAGDTVAMLLTAPKEQLCFDCHERAAMQQHISSSTDKTCLGCHDAHRSVRAMLLRRNINDKYADSSTVAAAPKSPSTSKLNTHVLHKRRPQHPQPTDHKL